jgi:hypothetical protein
LTGTSADPEDGRRLASLTRAGQQMAEKAAPNALATRTGFRDRRDDRAG